MKDQKITFETAKLAKEKGFDWNTYSDCWVKTMDDEIIHNSERRNIAEHDRVEVVYYEPTQSLLQKWLRDVHNINISILIRPFVKDIVTYIPFLNLYTGQGSRVHSDDPDISSTYEEALEIGLQQGLKLIK